MENLNFYGKFEISEPEKKSENFLLGPFFGTIRNELPVTVLSLGGLDPPDPPHFFAEEIS